MTCSPSKLATIPAASRVIPTYWYSTNTGRGQRQGECSSEDWSDTFETRTPDQCNEPCHIFWIGMTCMVHQSPRGVDLCSDTSTHCACIASAYTVTGGLRMRCIQSLLPWEFIRRLLKHLESDPRKCPGHGTAAHPSQDHSRRCRGPQCKLMHLVSL